MRGVVAGQHDGVFRRVQVEPHDILHLRCELGIAAHLVGPRKVRHQAIVAQNPGHRSTWATYLAPEQPTRPTAPSGGRRRQRHLDDLFHDGGGYRMILAPRLRLVCQPLHTAFAKATANSRHLLLRQANPIRDLSATHTVAAEQYDPRAPHMPSRCAGAIHNALQLLPLRSRQPQWCRLSHARLDASALSKVDLISVSMH